MTKKLQEAVVALQQLPAERQDELADALLDATLTTIEFSPEQQASIDRGIADANAGRFASTEEATSLFRR